VTFESEEQEAERRYAERQARLNEIKTGLTAKYEEFEEALRRRLMIRDMKVSMH